MKTHDLKCWSDHFDAILRHEKRFELRKDDRGFRAGDLLALRSYDPHKKCYTGNELLASVDYVLSGFPGLEDNYVIMSITVKTVSGAYQEDPK